MARKKSQEVQASREVPREQHLHPIMTGMDGKDSP